METQTELDNISDDEAEEVVKAIQSEISEYVDDNEQSQPDVIPYDDISEVDVIDYCMRSKYVLCWEVHYQQGASLAVKLLLFQHMRLLGPEILTRAYNHEDGREWNYRDSLLNAINNESDQVNEVEIVNQEEEVEVERTCRYSLKRSRPRVLDVL
jgi:hypothetical protein